MVAGEGCQVDGLEKSGELDPRPYHHLVALQQPSACLPKSGCPKGAAGDLQMSQGAVRPSLEKLHVLDFPWRGATAVLQFCGHAKHTADGYIGQ